MATLLQKVGTDFHRWHDSGDLQGTWHLAKIAAVAAMTPQVRHWLPTRELGIVKAYVEGGGVVPSNLLIRVSATMVDGSATRAWLHTSGVHTKERFFSPLSGEVPQKLGHVCPAPQQGNNCGKCRACWNVDVPHVSYHKH